MESGLTGEKQRLLQFRPHDCCIVTVAPEKSVTAETAAPWPFDPWFLNCTVMNVMKSQKSKRTRCSRNKAKDVSAAKTQSKLIWVTVNSSLIARSKLWVWWAVLFVCSNLPFCVKCSQNNVMVSWNNIISHCNVNFMNNVKVSSYVKNWSPNNTIVSR